MTAPAPRHLWIVGILALLWNAFGCFDYLMTVTNNEAYLSSFSAEERAYFQSFPAWSIAAWAFGVWGGLAGSILLLARKRLAIPAFVISLAGMAVAFFYQFGLSDALRIEGPAATIAPAIVVVVGILLLIYARRMTARGVLR